MKKHKKLLLLSVFAVMLFGMAVSLFLYQKLRPVVISGIDSEPLLIAHAMGGLSGAKYSNSLEAFNRNYAQGMRVFEADFQVTSDHVMILRHDWSKTRGQKGLLKEEGYIPTAEEFLSTPLYGKYTPLALSDLYELMKQHEDVYIITDTKGKKYDEVVSDFGLLVDTAKETGSLSCLDRFIVQIYNDEMYDAVCSVYPFHAWIYTLYQRGTDNFEQLCQFCQEKKIPVITINYKKLEDEFLELADQYGLKIYLHTVNDEQAALSYYKSGIDGFYTDEIEPKLFTAHCALTAQ